MENLIIKNLKETKTLGQIHFSSEEELEKLVFETPSILSDVHFLQRQARGMGGTPDIVGVDTNGNICVIEIKNIEVDARIRNQILDYAQRAEENPGTIKAFCLQHQDKLKDIIIDLSHYKVRVFIIAPSFQRSAIPSILKINGLYQTQLIEIKKRINEEDQMLLVNYVEQPETIINVPIGQPTEIDRNPESLIEFDKYVQEIENIIKEKSWDLEIKHCKYYCGFKSGFYNAFGIKWSGNKKFVFFSGKLSQGMAKKISEQMNIQMTKYDKLWKQAIFTIQPGVTNINDLMPIMEYCYKKINK